MTVEQFSKMDMVSLNAEYILNLETIIPAGANGWVTRSWADQSTVMFPKFGTIHTTNENLTFVKHLAVNDDNANTVAALSIDIYDILVKAYKSMPEWAENDINRAVDSLAAMVEMENAQLGVK